jgi:hypothetical protein
MLDQGLGGADEGWLLSSADRVAAGQVYYRDLDAYPFPGASYLLAAAFRAFGVHLAVSRALEALLFCAMVACLYGIACRVLVPARAALFGACLLGMKVVAWPTFSVYSHYDVAFTGACGALWLLLRHPFAGPSRALFGAGACMGAALVSKQNVGVYLFACTAFLIALARPLLGAPAAGPRRRIAEVACLGAGVAAVALPFAIHFAVEGVFGAMLASAFLRPLSEYLPTSGVSYGVPLRWWELGSMHPVVAFIYFPLAYWLMIFREQLPYVSDYTRLWLAGELFARTLYTALPVAFAASFLLVARAVIRRDTGAERAFVIASLGSLAVVASAFPRADFAHVISVYPVVLLLVFACWERVVALRLPRAIWLEGALVAAGLAGCAWLALARSAQLTETIDLPRAHFRAYPHDAYIESAVRYIEAELAPGERLFVYGSDASYYFLTGRHYGWPFPQLYPGHEGGDGGRALVELLRRQPPAMVIQASQRIPGMPPLASYAPELDAYVRETFRHDPWVFRRYPPPEGHVPLRGYFALMREPSQIRELPPRPARSPRARS